MATRKAHSAALALARRQNGVVSCAQLDAIGFTRAAIRHALLAERFRHVRRGVVAVGVSEVGVLGRLTAVSLAFPDAAISHLTAAVAWELCDCSIKDVHLTVPLRHQPRGRDLVVHRRDPMPKAARHRGIRLTAPLETLIDLAASEPDLLEHALNEADKRRLIRLDRAREQLERIRPARGTGRLRAALDAHTVTDSVLERRFLKIVRESGLPAPRTQVRVNGFRVDFYWPELSLIVETDGLTYHRTPAQQAKDRRRDQIHTAAGLTCLRFTNAQVVREPAAVVSLLSDVIARLNSSVRKRSL